MTPAARFRATLYRLGINFCLDVPEQASRVLGGGPFVPVRGAANDVEFATTLVPRGGGAYRLFLDGRVREGASLAKGDAVEVVVERDEHPLEPPPPDELLAALDATDGAIETFFALPDGLRREVLRYLEAAKRPQTLQRRVERIVELVQERMLGVEQDLDGAGAER